MVLRLLAALSLLLGLTAGAAQAQSVSSADRAAIREVIQSQVDAFQRDDGPAAFGYASPSIQGMFGSPDIFMDMVRQGYQPVYRPRAFDFRALAIDTTTPVPPVVAASSASRPLPSTVAPSISSRFCDIVPTN